MSSLNAGSSHGHSAGIFSFDIDILRLKWEIVRHAIHTWQWHACSVFYNKTHTHTYSPTHKRTVSTHKKNTQHTHTYIDTLTLHTKTHSNTHTHTHTANRTLLKDSFGAHPHTHQCSIAGMAVIISGLHIKSEKILWWKAKLWCHKDTWIQSNPHATVKFPCGQPVLYGGPAFLPVAIQSCSRVAKETDRTMLPLVSVSDTDHACAWTFQHNSG